MGNVRPCHVAGDQHCVGIVWADARIEHRAPAPRANDFEVARTSRKCQSCQQGTDNQGAGYVCHSMLSFAFVIFASTLSCNRAEMSTPKWRSSGDRGKVLRHGGFIKQKMRRRVAKTFREQDWEGHGFSRAE